VRAPFTVSLRDFLPPNLGGGWTIPTLLLRWEEFKRVNIDDRTTAPSQSRDWVFPVRESH